MHGVDSFREITDFELQRLLSLPKRIHQPIEITTHIRQYLRVTSLSLE